MASRTRKDRRRVRSIAIATAFVACAGVLFASQAAAESPEQALAREVLDATGVQGGLVVHLGCGDGKLTAALRASDAYLVHGLDSDEGNVERARQHVRSLGLYGPVSVDRLSRKRLPYVDNVVNLVVAEDADMVPSDEITRVLAPGGVAYVRSGSAWQKTVKPRPAEIDEWTHYLHDSTNNAVADDSRVGPPRHLQWIGGPKWARSHDHLASTSALVTSGGRIFYITDEAPIAAIVLPSEWTLVARDAFSGVVLWKRPVDPWEWHLRGFRSGPTELARRLVAVGDRVYVTLGHGEPLAALDAATGRTVTTYDGTAGTLEVIHRGGTLFLVVGDPAAEQAAAEARRRGLPEKIRSQRPGYEEILPIKHLVAIDAASGKLLWQKADADTKEMMPTTLATDGNRVCFQSPGEVICLDPATGKENWRAERPTALHRPSWSAPSLVIYDDMVLSGDRAAPSAKPSAQGDRRVHWIVASAGGQAPVGELIAFSAATGERLWSSPCKECYNSPADVLVAGGLVWTGQLVRASEPGITQGLDPKTGEVKFTRPADGQFFAIGMNHHRCYRNKATCQWLVLGRAGVEFVDLATGDAIANHWTRGTCQLGVMPANGLLYAPPHSCACFIKTKLNAFNCLAPKRGDERAARDEEDEATRLQKGPAYDQATTHHSPPATSSPWPTYRHDAARSGATPSPIAAKLAPAWQADLGGRLTPATVAEGKVFVAAVDRHIVHALGAADGKPAWSFTTGGRVDSPPTIDAGRVLFGSADGSVYCLRAADGRLAWRFQAAPEDRRVVVFGQLESAWPVHGSVLVDDGVVYATAGRSSYLDGGIRLYRLDAATGNVLSKTTVDSRDPETGYQPKGVVRGTEIPGALSDVLSCDGTSVFMRHTRFDRQGVPQPGDVPHLYSSAGFLDDSWWHRTFWQVAAQMGSNYGGWPQTGNRVPAGRLLAMDGSGIYGFGRDNYIHHGSHVGIDGSTIFHYSPQRDKDRRQTHYRLFATATAGGKKPTYRWTQDLPILARAMVLAPEKLLLAGPPDILTAEDPTAAMEGRAGGRLLTVSTADGKTLADQPLESPPVLDGLSAAAGRLYLVTLDGKVRCYGDE